MSGQRKNLLIMGLKKPYGKVHSEWGPEQINKIIAEQFKILDDAGFDAENYAVDIDNPSTVDEVKQLLKDKKRDAVSVGFALRGEEDLTPLFEKIVNVVVESGHPSPKLMFAVKPSGVSEAVRRAFPEHFEAKA